MTINNNTQPTPQPPNVPIRVPTSFSRQEWMLLLAAVQACTPTGGNSPMGQLLNKLMEGKPTGLREQRLFYDELFNLAVKVQHVAVDEWLEGEVEYSGTHIEAKIHLTHPIQQPVVRR